MRDPDIEGPYGRAWFMPYKDPEVPDHQACLGSWLLNVPGAHPFWEYWLVTIIHLRDIPGSRPAIKHYAEAEYEFGINSINPEECPAPDPDNVREGYPLLQPSDVVEQFHGISDRDALRVAEAGVRAMVHGRISPDQDFRSMWSRLISDTVAHFRAGAHVEN